MNQPQPPFPRPLCSHRTAQEQPTSTQSQQPAQSNAYDSSSRPWPSYGFGSRANMQMARVDMRSDRPSAPTGQRSKVSKNVARYQHLQINQRRGQSRNLSAGPPAPSYAFGSPYAPQGAPGPPFVNASASSTLSSLNDSSVGSIHRHDHLTCYSSISPSSSHANGSSSPNYGLVGSVSSRVGPQRVLSNAIQTPVERPIIETFHEPSLVAGPSHESGRLPSRSSSPQTKKLGDTLFQYTSLGATQGRIRLLRILPNTAPYIKCELFETSLANPQAYIAISYCWGDTEDTRTISIDGYDFPITESLWSALCSFQSRTHAVIVWADAVCIDQSNVAERNIQVQAMTKVYSQAYEVAVWLGPEYEDSSNALQWIQQINHLYDLPYGDQKFKEIITDPACLSHLQALVCLFERSYWSRLWVVQEVHNAKDLNVYCGSASLPWTCLTQISSIFRLHLNDLTQAFQEKVSVAGYTWATILSNHGPARLWDIREASRTGLLPNLIFHRSKACVDARDKVFGLLGILSLYEIPQIVVDYNMSVREVYINVVEHVLRTTGRLDVICASVHFPWHQSAEVLPSWVPDWSQTDAQPPISFLLSSNFNASGSGGATYSFSCQRRRLKISAIPIDVVHICGTHLSPPRSINTILIVMFQWRLRLLELVGTGSSNTAAHEAFCRTLCLDRGRDQISPRDLLEWTYHNFAIALQEKYPYLALDDQLKSYANIPMPNSTYFQNLVFEDYFADAMAGRRFFVTSNGLLCLGSGATRSSDLVCVPLGCSTPIILRKINEGYKYVGDVYVDGYMYGKAVEEMKTDMPYRQLQSCVLI